MVPFMVGCARFSQHQAVGTSSAAVAMVGASGCISFGSVGAVDFVAACTVAATAMVGARFGAKLTGAFSAVQLTRAFAVFQLIVAPMVPLKGALVRRSKASGTADADQVAGGVSASAVETTTPTPTPTPTEGGSWLSPAQIQQTLPLLLVGVVSGLASGMFGIGGGVVVTPALCMVTELPYSTVLGTTLTAMVPSAIVSVATHHRMGNVVTQAVLPLCVGSGLGAFCGGQLAVRVPEEPLQILFSIVIFALGGQKLYALRGVKG